MNRMKKLLIGCMATALITTATAFAQTGEETIEKMHRRYHGKAAGYLTFTQHNVHYDEKGQEKNKSIWYEALAYPDRFRIDFGEPKEGNAVIFARDSVFQFKNGQPTAKAARRNDLILAAGGFLYYPLDQAKQRLRQAGYDLTKGYTTEWQGQKVYVIGAQSAQDSTAKQLWVEKKRLVLLRTLETLPDGSVQEGRFGKHQKTAGGYTETEVLFLKNKIPAQLEEYRNLKVMPTLDNRLFDATWFGRLHWKE
jgi:outer membrane lipoprotein-sorting protein